MRAEFIIVILLLNSLITKSQESTRFNKLEDAARKKYDRIWERLEQSTEKHLRKQLKLELNWKTRLTKRDPVAVKPIFGSVNDEYSKTNNIAAENREDYDGYVDTLKTALLFIATIPSFKESSVLHALDGRYNNIQKKFNKITYIQNQFKERTQIIKEKTKELGVDKYILKCKRYLNKYTSQVQKCKLLFKKPIKLETIVVNLANKIPEFKQFFDSRSQLATLFNLPGNNIACSRTVEGLQTRAMVMEETKQRTGYSSLPTLRQNIVTAPSGIDQVKNQLKRSGDAGDGIDIPEDNSASQQTKQFLKRLEYGTSMQSARGNLFTPISTDISLSVGYRIRPTSVLGIASCYRIGWGKDIRHLHITKEAIGFKINYELKLKGSFWIRGSGEMNHHLRYKDIDAFKAYGTWQKSALAGISKKYSVAKKINGNLQLLYDFLHAKKIPVAQPVFFRAGYTF